MRRSRRRCTLLELLIVLVIMALVSRAVAIRSYGRPASSNAEMRSAARQLASGLRLARSEAVSQRRETFLVIDLAGRRFKVDRDAREHALPRNVELKLFTAQKDLVDDKVGSIRFYPDGGSNGGRITLGIRRSQIRSRRRLADRPRRDPGLMHDDTRVLADANRRLRLPAGGFRCSRCWPRS